MANNQFLCYFLVFVTVTFKTFQIKQSSILTWRPHFFPRKIHSQFYFQESFCMKDIMNDLEILKSKMERGNIERGLVLYNEKASKVGQLNWNVPWVKIWVNLNRLQIKYWIEELEILKKLNYYFRFVSGVQLEVHGQRLWRGGQRRFHRPAKCAWSYAGNDSMIITTLLNVLVKRWWWIIQWFVWKTRGNILFYWYVQ